MPQAEKPVHTSVNLEPKLHRALTTKLFKERRTIAEWVREQAAEFVGRK